MHLIGPPTKGFYVVFMNVQNLVGIDAVVFSEREREFTFVICCRPCVCLSSVVCLSVVCLSSVTFVRPTQVVQIFGNVSTALGTLAIR